MRPILILRPEPGASETGARAVAVGLEAVIAPIFTIEALAWEPPSPAMVDAVLLTSPNSARLGGPSLNAFLHLPCYAVGETTAAAAAVAGFSEVHTGPSDGAAMLRLAADSGVGSAFHPHGRDHIPLQNDEMTVESRAVYASEVSQNLPPDALSAVRRGALVMLHSPRAAGHFARLLEESGVMKHEVDLLLISEAAAIAAGPDWRSVEVASAPRDHALLELAAKLCQTGGATDGK